MPQNVFKSLSKVVFHIVSLTAVLMLVMQKHWLRYIHLVKSDIYCYC